MTMYFLALAALVLSGAGILILCLGDPKRQRAVGDHGRMAMAAPRRRLLAILACLPGLGCALIGDAAAFMMWLGGCALIGWGVAAALRGTA